MPLTSLEVSVHLVRLDGAPGYRKLRKERKERKDRKHFNGYRMVCEVGCGLVLSLTGRFAAGGFALRSPH